MAGPLTQEQLQQIATIVAQTFVQVGIQPGQAGTPSKGAAAKPREYSGGSDYEDSPDSPKDDSSDRVKARNNPLYNAKPDKDGLYRCPFTKRADKCNHQPTKQKCIYS